MKTRKMKSFRTLSQAAMLFLAAAFFYSISSQALTPRDKNSGTIPYPSQPPLAIGSEKEFWLWDLTVMPPSFRKANLRLRAVGKRSYVYVEEQFWKKSIDQAMLDHFMERLEKKSPAGAISPDYGIIPLEESVFATLPSKINPDERVSIVFADLGKYKHYEFDGFFNAFDQTKEENAWSEHQQHSNESNIIYINGLRQNEEYTLGVIAHELHHLLAHSAVADFANFQQDLWLSESLAEGAMILTGYFTDQGHVNRYAQSTSSYPLVTQSYVQYGPQLLFASFLIDTLGRHGGMGELTRAGIKGRDAIEALFQNRTSAPISFDAIYSNFIAYVYNASVSGEKLPNTKNKNDNYGMNIPPIKVVDTIEQYPSIKEHVLLPYSFAVYDLKNELPPGSVVRVERVDQINDTTPTKDCGKNELPLWKPLSSKSLAIYAVGCEHTDKNDAIRVRLSIFEKPSIFFPSAFRLAF